jgi:ABC-type sugar transport system ATPase subunit
MFMAIASSVIGGTLLTGGSSTIIGAFLGAAVLGILKKRESAIILDLIRRLKEKGEVSIIIVAHNYAHIFDVCDRVSLLQNGEIAFDRLTKETSVEELMNLALQELRSERERSSRS